MCGQDQEEHSVTEGQPTGHRGPGCEGEEPLPPTSPSAKSGWPGVQDGLFLSHALPLQENAPGDLVYPRGQACSVTGVPTTGSHSMSSGHGRASAGSGLGCSDHYCDSIACDSPQGRSGLGTAVQPMGQLGERCRSMTLLLLPRTGGHCPQSLCLCRPHPRQRPEKFLEWELPC